MTSYSDWPSLDELLTSDINAPLALLGAPLGLGSVTPGRCDLAPDIFRQTLPRISTYDLETEDELCGLSIFDTGNLPIEALSPADAFSPIQQALSSLAGQYALSIMIGGNNAVTRPGVHALSSDLSDVGLLTLDAHFDLRPTDQGLINGNPVQALLDDGLPGHHIVQVGLAPFANSKAMHDTAKAANIEVYTLGQCRDIGLINTLTQGLNHLSNRCRWVYVDFDIDVIERAASPGAPGGRAGGFSPQEFFAATRHIAAHPKVRAVDLTEFDPSLDLNATTALISARWLAEILTGFQHR